MAIGDQSIDEIVTIILFFVRSFVSGNRHGIGVVDENRHRIGDSGPGIGVCSLARPSAPSPRIASGSTVGTASTNCVLPPRIASVPTPRVASVRWTERTEGCTRTRGTHGRGAVAFVRDDSGCRFGRSCFGGPDAPELDCCRSSDLQRGRCRGSDDPDSAISEHESEGPTVPVPGTRVTRERPTSRPFPPTPSFQLETSERGEGQPRYSRLVTAESLVSN